LRINKTEKRNYLFCWYFFVVLVKKN